MKGAFTPDHASRTAASRSAVMLAGTHGEPGSLVGNRPTDHATGWEVPVPLRHPTLRRARRVVSGRALTVAQFLRTDRSAGLILLGATALALIVANSPLAGCVRPAQRTPSRPAGAAPRPVRGDVGRRTACWRSSSWWPGWSSNANSSSASCATRAGAMLPIAGRARRHDRAGPLLPAVAFGAGGAGGLGGARRHRHRVRARRARHHARGLPASLRVFLLSLRSSTISARSC